MEEADVMSREVLKLSEKCKKLIRKNKKKAFQKLMSRRAALLTQLPLGEGELPSLSQAIKDAVREKVDLEGKCYRGGFAELHRLRADLLQLCTSLVNSPSVESQLSAATLAEQLLVRASRTRNGADAYFAVGWILKPPEGWILKPLDGSTYPIDLRLFAHGSGIWGQVNTMSQYGLFKLEDLLESDDPNGPEPWLPIDAQVIEQIDFNHNRSLRFLRILLINKDAQQGNRQQRTFRRRFQALTRFFRRRRHSSGSGGGRGEFQHPPNSNVGTNGRGAGAEEEVDDIRSGNGNSGVGDGRAGDGRAGDGDAARARRRTDTGDSSSSVLDNQRSPNRLHLMGDRRFATTPSAASFAAPTVAAPSNNSSSGDDGESSGSVAIASLEGRGSDEGEDDEDESSGSDGSSLMALPSLSSSEALIVDGVGCGSAVSPPLAPFDALGAFLNLPGFRSATGRTAEASGGNGGSGDGVFTLEHLSDWWMSSGGDREKEQEEEKQDEAKTCHVDDHGEAADAGSLLLWKRLQSPVLGGFFKSLEYSEVETPNDKLKHRRSHRHRRHRRRRQIVGEGSPGCHLNSLHDESSDIEYVDFNDDDDDDDDDDRDNHDHGHGDGDTGEDEHEHEDEASGGGSEVPSAFWFANVFLGENSNARGRDDKPLHGGFFASLSPAPSLSPWALASIAEEEHYGGGGGSSSRHFPFFGLSATPSRATATGAASAAAAAASASPTDADRASNSPSNHDGPSLHPTYAGHHPGFIFSTRDGRTGYFVDERDSSSRWSSASPAGLSPALARAFAAVWEEGRGRDAARKANGARRPRLRVGGEEEEEEEEEEEQQRQRRESSSAPRINNAGAVALLSRQDVQQLTTARHRCRSLSSSSNESAGGGESASSAPPSPALSPRVIGSQTMGTVGGTAAAFPPIIPALQIDLPKSAHYLGSPPPLPPRYNSGQRKNQHQQWRRSSVFGAGSGGGGGACGGGPLP